MKLKEWESRFSEGLWKPSNSGWTCCSGWSDRSALSSGPGTPSREHCPGTSAQLEATWAAAWCTAAGLAHQRQSRVLIPTAVYNRDWCCAEPSCVSLFATPWTAACQASLPVGFPGQEFWSGLPFPTPGDLPDQGLNCHLLHLLQTDRVFTTDASWKVPDRDTQNRGCRPYDFNEIYSF